jgi:hypothetical protein
MWDAAAIDAPIAMPIVLKIKSVMDEFLVGKKV